MMKDKNSILEEVKAFKPFNEQEEKDKITFIEFMNTFEDVLTRKNIFGHLTASAFVVNEDLSKTLLVNHNIFGGFIYPGGHADGETDLFRVAKREVEEETGLVAEPLINSKIFAIQTTPIKGHIKKGEYISAHIHYDILYLLVAKNLDMEKIRILESENSAVKWVSLEESFTSEDNVDWIRPINEKIVTRVRSLKK
jgi:8-oxo-dGTP pyrophosphatase MutT (NUDIX family)